MHVSEEGQELDFLQLSEQLITVYGVQVHLKGLLDHCCIVYKGILVVQQCLRGVVWCAGLY